MNLDMKTLGGGSLLAGASEGRAVQERLLAAVLSEFSDLVELDFSGVEVATASFLREAIFGLRSALEREGVRTPIVVSNTSAAIEDDLAIVARSLNTAIVLKNSDSKGRVLGVLDEQQRHTLSELNRLREASATELHEKVTADREVQVTAWNNRLASLANKGVVVEVRRGREKRYRPVLEELEYGR